METQNFYLQDLKPAPYNPRKISEKALQGLRESLKTFGYVQPIVVNIRGGKNVVVGGHQRITALEMEGISKVECVVVDLDATQEKALNIALNSQEISGEFVVEDLEPLLRELKQDFPEFEELRLDDLAKSLDIDLSEALDGLKGDGDDEENQQPLRWFEPGDIVDVEPIRIQCSKEASYADVGIFQELVSACAFQKRTKKIKVNGQEAVLTSSGITR